MSVTIAAGMNNNTLLRWFASIMTYAEKMTLRNTLRDLTDTLDASNITYHICGGTLIGSYRHHGIIPWDDDIDIYVRWSDRFRMEDQIRKNLSDYVLKKAPTRWKLYSRNQSIPIPGWSWNYPFVDICFTVESNTSVWDYDTNFGTHFRYNMSTVYPLQRRPFMQLSLWAPNDVETYLKTTYDIKKCLTNVYIHKTEKGSRSHEADCEPLYPYFPFVFRSTIQYIPGVTIIWNEGVDKNEVTLEELKINGSVLSCVMIK